MLEDSWKIDFLGGKPIRHHRAYRVDWFVPGNSCPIQHKEVEG